ncbi:MAG: omptin family outer membrane protease [Spirochaetaceae bacterium]|nr:omptin family outer membrane protease [Spirochaetaceae bacterium]
MKRSVFLALLLFTLNLSSLIALQSHDGILINEEDNVGFTIEPSFGYLKGETREIVYLHALTSTYLSELIWDMKDILYAGASASINFKNRIYLNLGLWAAVNSGNGFMMDFDWISGEIESDGYDRENWTRWSMSSVDMVSSFIFDLNVSYDFLLNRDIKFSAIFGYKSLYWDWSDKVIDSFYDGVADVIPVGIDGIDYQLGLDIFYLGIGGGYFSKGFILDGRIIYSPFVFGGDHDHHILRNTFPDGSPTYGGIHFFDKILFGQYAAFSIKSGYSFSNNFTLTFQISAEYLFERRGDTYIYDNLGNYKGKSPGEAGIQYQTISFSLNAAFSF